MLTDEARLTLPSRYSREIYSATELVAELKQLRRPVEDISFLSRARQHSFITGVKLGQLVLHEARASPAVAKANIDPGPSFLIPFSHPLTLVEDGRSILLPAETHITVMTVTRPGELHYAPLHLLGIRPDLDELRKAVSAIIGRQDDLARIVSLDRTVAFPGHISETDYIEQLLALVSVVNGTGGDLPLLNRIGVDDIFTRVLAEFLVESVTGAPASPRPEKITRSRAAVDLICSHIEDHVGMPLTVVKMERMTGMTGRALNYAFQERFGCSPQQWQRRYLLDHARKRLMDRNDLTSVKSIAYDVGFASAGSFTSHYQRRFGELPSTTRTDALATSRGHVVGKEGNE